MAEDEEKVLPAGSDAAGGVGGTQLCAWNSIDVSSRWGTITVLRSAYIGITPISLPLNPGKIAPDQQAITMRKS